MEINHQRNIRRGFSHKTGKGKKESSSARQYATGSHKRETSSANQYGASQSASKGRSTQGLNSMTGEKFLGAPVDENLIGTSTADNTKPGSVTKGKKEVGPVKHQKGSPATPAPKKPGGRTLTSYGSRTRGGSDL